MPSAVGYERLKRAGEMGRLALLVPRKALVPPYSWGWECMHECSLALRRCLLPAALAMSAFSIGLSADFFGGVVRLLGTADRLGGGILLGYTREPAMWMTIMLLAGVAGSSMTADLGSRKVREELDALKVLGVEETRGLVIPRVLAFTLAAPVLGVFLLVVAWLVAYAAIPIAFHANTVTPTAFIESSKAFLSPLDLVSLLIKNLIAGFVVGLVCCYKGINSTGGAEGVGRAVNEAVLICFISAWLINILFNVVFLSTFPSVSMLRG
jgi:phospholipid/cholesterol/gamma-HCH transport system permease protein